MSWRRRLLLGVVMALALVLMSPLLAFARAGGGSHFSGGGGSFGGGGYSGGSYGGGGGLGGAGFLLPFTLLIAFGLEFRKQIFQIFAPGDVAQVAANRPDL